jgi:hypothetical protein
MSIPKNHHYVSKCQQKEFFNKSVGKIFVYDKLQHRHYPKSSSKTLFSEDFINSIELNGEVNHEQLELELKILIEDHYPKHLSIVQKFTKDLQDREQTYDSLVWLLILGVLGELRNPLFKESFESISQNIEIDLLARRTGYSKAEIKDFLKCKQKTKFSNLVGYFDTAFRILERMEPFDFAIYSIESTDHFILPDTSGFQLRGQLHNYPNRLINEIIQIGLPISDKLFILGTSKHLQNTPNGIKSIKEDNSEIVFAINKDLYNFSYKTVACSDSDFLSSFINKIKDIN